MAMDDDTSYLDEASRAPAAPTGVPGADSVTNKVRLNIVAKPIATALTGQECYIRYWSVFDL